MWRAAERNADDRAFCDAVAFADCTAIVAARGLAHIDRGPDGPRQGAGQRCAPTRPQEDIPIMMFAAASVMRNRPASEAWRRYLTLMMDGLRAS